MALVSAIVVMGGSGSRMGINKNKALLPLGDKPIFMHSVDLFLSLGYEVILVIRECDLSKIRKYVKDVKIVFGGTTRSESVYNGLQVCTQEIVLVHDAARPLVSLEVVRQCVDVIKENKAVFVGKMAVDTLRMKKDSFYQTLDRSKICYAQTPQGSKRKILRKAYELEMSSGFSSTDEIMILEKHGVKNIEMVLGNEDNFKITTKRDYILAKEIVGASND